MIVAVVISAVTLVLTASYAVALATTVRNGRFRAEELDAILFDDDEPRGRVTDSFPDAPQPSQQS